MSDRLALTIANSEFDDPKLTRLATPSRDAKALAKVLRDPEIGGFYTTVLLNKPLRVVRREVARLYNRRKKDDLLLLYYSGHGFKDDFGDLYLAVKDTEKDVFDATTIDAAFIRGQLDRSHSQRKVVVLDCCHSGAFARGAKGMLGSNVGTQEAFAGTGYGRVILTASNAVEYAWEGDKLLGEAETSLFTHFLVQGLRTGAADLDSDGKISLNELYEYVYDQVLSSGVTKQTPEMWAQKVQGQILIAHNPHLARRRELEQLYQGVKASVERQAWAEAVDLCQRVQALEPGYRDVADLLQTAREGLHREQAEKERQAQLTRWYDHAQAALGRGRWQRAKQLITDIQALDPGYRDARQLLERAEAGRRREQDEKERQAQLTLLYEGLQTAAAGGDWAEVLALGGQIQALAPSYRDVTALMEQARTRLSQPIAAPQPSISPTFPPPTATGRAAGKAARKPRERLAWPPDRPIPWNWIAGVGLAALGLVVVFLLAQGASGDGKPELLPTNTTASVVAAIPTSPDALRPTATSKQTDTALSQPFNTPEPTATITPFPPPALVGRELIGCSVILRWSWSGTLTSDEWFAVRIGKENLESRVWTKEQEYVIRLEEDGEYTWEIAIIKGNPPEVREQLAVSEPDYFNVDGCSLPPSSTPTKTSTITTPLTPVPPTPTASPAFALGDTQTRSTDGMVMVYVPGGTFQMGSTDGQSYEQPVHPVTLDDFWIDRTEVTNGQYEQCVDARVCRAPTTCDWGEPTYEDVSRANHPVVCVDWHGARAYCAWARARLPTEAEWEYAARGPDGYIYPWGNSAPDCDKTNYSSCVGETIAVGSYPDGTSWCGAHDMAGNVWEWVADWYGDYSSEAQTNPAGPETGDSRVWRGGSKYGNAYSIRSVNREWIDPHNRFGSRGFRCVVASTSSLP
jgi:formylglycine-generating enzyme required for sulfatase activity